ncbi:MAG: hypothetical protein QG597_2053 [Actinomycetota bacterium]|nr:hypothetical protein [Actinomycetota bacterium]
MPRLILIVAFGVVITAGFAVFGLPSYQLPMPTWALGVVTPTCGLTRASTALARGDLGLAWAFNPAAFLLAGVAMTGVARWVVGRTRHVWINVTFHLTRLGWLVVLGLFILLWINQQLHADLVMHGSV